MATRRRRRGAQEGEFEDPLKDYSTPTYADETERRLCEGRVGDLQITPYITIDANQTVEQALRLMADKNIAYMMVLDNDRLAGIFSERDVLHKVAEQYQQIKSRPLRDVMTTNPVVVHDTDPPAKAINLMAIGGFRHLPVLDVDDQIVGVLGPRRVTAYLCQQFGKD